MAKRFIKIYEQIADWEWFRHPNTLALFIYLLVKANYKDVEVSGTVIKRGQLVTSLTKISTGVGLTIQQARTALSHLKSTGEITDEPSNQSRLITIVKYNDYQTPTGKTTADQQAINTQPNRQSTRDSTPSIEYIDNIEKIERKNKESMVTASRFTPPTLEEVTLYCQERGNTVNPARWYDYYSSNGWRVGKNPMKDWRAAVRTWESGDNRPAAPARQNPAQEYHQRDYSDVSSPDAMMEVMFRQFKEAGF